MWNVDWIYRLPGPARAAGYFGLQTLIGSRILHSWREALRWRRLSPLGLKQAVETNLDQTLRSAISNSPYYRSLNLSASGTGGGHAFLQCFPTLARETVRERFRDIVVDRLQKEITSPASICARRYGWLVVKTGGTTGVPTSVVHDARFRDSGRATRLLSQALCGFPLGTRYVRLWGSEQDLLQQRENLDRRLLRNLLGEVPLNAFRAKEADLAKHVLTIRAHPEAKHLMAYVDAAAGLAYHLRDRKQSLRFKTIMACAGTVTPEWRQLLQETFQADVFDKYGSRECADIACECARHSGLHIYSQNVFVEVVDESNRPCPVGVPGRILVTLLNNPGFPLIRYEIGDIGAWASDEPCLCGLPFPRLESIQGRQDDMLTTEDGTRLSSVFVRHFVGVSLNRELIREWQLEQRARNDFVFRYMPLANSGLQENLAALKESFHRALGATVSIQLEPVSEIPASATGKVRWILNSVRR